MKDSRPLVAHVMYRFDTGGLENGIVNLINHMPDSRLPPRRDFTHRDHRISPAHPAPRCRRSLP